LVILASREIIFMKGWYGRTDEDGDRFTMEAQDLDG
jgi:hypothetical protein